MDEREITCCFTGHRDSGLPWGKDMEDPRCVALKSEIYARTEGLYKDGYRHFISGMALGGDTYFAQAVLELKEKYPDITLEAAIPCRTQPYRWKSDEKLEYSSLVSKCDKVTVLHELYSYGCMMDRNKYMVDHSSMVLAVFDGIPGGTMNTILYAKRSEVPVLVIDVQDYYQVTEAENE